LGRFYTRKKGNLYIYVTDKEELIEPNAFPEELNLFGAESAWRLSNWMAICKELQEEKLDQAERILKMNGFSPRNLEELILEEYFRSGDESLIKGKTLAPKLKGRLPTPLKERGGSPEPIIMPEMGASYMVEPKKGSRHRRASSIERAPNRCSGP
jgi:hypothetical protein